MWNRDEMSSMIENYIRRLQFPDEPGDLYAPIVYALESGGKRLRPLLVLLSYGMWGDRPEEVLPCAAAVEVFHNFTLVHDDIMDHAMVRRGKPTVQRRWNTNTAILSGDAMMIFSYRLLEQTPGTVLPAVLSAFNEMALRVCEGQGYDMDFEGLENVAPEEYLKMIADKTSALLVGAVTIGALVGGASTDDCKKLRQFAYELGLAFQIQDDLLDCYGTEQSLGKRIGGDILEGKKSFLTVHALRLADSKTALQLSGLLHNREMVEEEKIARVLALYDGLGVRRVAEDAVETYTKSALEALEAVSVAEDRKTPMRQLAEDLIRRNK